jgi:gliding motility-associated-like protein
MGYCKEQLLMKLMKMNFLRHFKLLLFLLIASTANQLNSQVVINEFCTANYTDWIVSGENEDWVEMYNPTSAPVDITGYYLSDNASNPQKWAFPAGSIVPANGFLVVLLSGTGDYAPNYLGYRNTSFKVTQTNGEPLLFSNTSGTILEQYDLSVIGAFQANHSYARTTDGGAIWAIHTDPSPNASNSGPNYATYATKPVFSVEAGWKPGPISVTLTAEPGCTIYYTTNGANPSTATTQYTGPIALSVTTTLRAISIPSDPSALPSLIETNTYFFGADVHSIYTVNIAGPTLSDGSWWGDEACHIEFFAGGGTFIVEAGGDSNEHGNDSNAYPQRGFDYVTRDAMGYDNEIQYPLFHHHDRPGYERLIFKGAANDQYPTEPGGAHVRDAYVHELSILGDLHLDERTSEFCVLYINGVYWGVYDFREKADDIDYTDYHFDQPEGMVDYLKTWGGTWTEYGSDADWITLRNFVLSNDMTNAANYNYVLSQYNHMSLIDYFILNGYVVCTDWLNWNTAWWRGRHPDGDARRWRYVLWDMDATFGHYINYTGVPSTGPTADPCQIDNMGNVGGQGHVPMLNALFNNTEFLADYVQRYATLSNTIFSCDRMIAVLDSMVNTIEPEMARQCARWGGTVAGWQANVQQVRDFILLRCNDEIIDGIADCYNVTPITVTVEIEGIGEIEFETHELDNTTAPFTGTYFADLPIDLIAFVADGGALCGTFAGWEIVSGTAIIADPLSPTTTVIFQTDAVIRAVFQDANTGPVVITTDMNLPGAGVLTVNTVAQLTYPNTTTINPGESTTIAVTPNEWYTFDYWESANGTTFNPGNTSTSITISTCQSDTITAFFTHIPNFQLTVQVDPSGGGYIRFGSDSITTTGVIYHLEGGLPYNFSAYPYDQWSTFSHWTTDGVNQITPDELTASIVLELLANGTLTAVFTQIPHYPVTVMLDPPYDAGTVIFEEEFVSGNSYMTETQRTEILEGNKSLLFEAKPNEYWKFTGWTSKIHQPSPSATQSTVAYKFMAPDTIVAHFEKEDFLVFVPNSFTPNNDGKNDVFKVEGSAVDLEGFHLLIFNRWGDVVFESSDIETVWVGEVQSGDYYYAQTQAYNYVLKIKSVHEMSPREMSGTILVLR